MRISEVQYATSRRSSNALPSSPSTRSASNASSSDFEFDIIGSSAATDDHERSFVAGAELTPADDLFYKGKILPLQPTPRLSMVKSLFFASSSSASSISSANSRHSTGSSSSSDVAIFREFTCESPNRPSFVTDFEEGDEDFIISEPMNLNTFSMARQSESHSQSNSVQRTAKKSKSFSFGKISSVFKKEPRSVAGKCTASGPLNGKSASSSAARDVIRKYMNKVKPLYEKMAPKHSRVLERESSAVRDSGEAEISSNELFSDNLIKDRNGQGVVMSCPASIRSSPCHSSMLLRANQMMSSKDSSTEELQSAIQGAIAHCKNSMLQNKS